MAPEQPDILKRFERDIEAIYSRLRTVENVDTPRQKEFLQEIRDLRGKVGDMDVRGTAVTQERIGRIQDGIKNLSDKFDEFKDEVDHRFDKIDEYQASIRTTIRGALITGAIAIGGNIILWAVTRGGS